MENGDLEDKRLLIMEIVIDESWNDGEIKLEAVIVQKDGGHFIKWAKMTQEI